MKNYQRTMTTLLFIVSLLAGCVPAVFVAGAASGGMVATDKRSLSTQWDDKKIQVAAYRAINRNRALNTEGYVSVTSFNGIVLLTGTAPNAESRTQASQIVRDMPGVKQVYNKLRVGSKPSLGSISKDTWITTKVKSDLLTDDGLRSMHIKVVTDMRKVYLFGIISHQQADRATQIARHVSGVQEVIRVFQYT